MTDLHLDLLLSCFNVHPCVEPPWEVESRENEVTWCRSDGVFITLLYSGEEMGEGRRAGGVYS